MSGSRITVQQVAEAAGVSRATITRWARFGLLPPPTVHYGLTPGRHSFWAEHAPAQARWVAQKLAAGLTFDQVRDLLKEVEDFEADSSGG